MTLFGRQCTLQTAYTLQGHGVHSGEPVTLQLCPAPEDTGIVFKRTDVSTARNEVLARYDQVSATQLGTSITNDAGITVHTIEHLMAALWGGNIDNAIVLLDGPEVPIMDGSADPFMAAIEQAGLLMQSAPRHVIEVLEPIHTGTDEAWLSLAPSDHFTVDLTIAFHSRHIGKQQCAFHAEQTSFRDAFASARTFGLLHEVNHLRANGFAKGGSLDNAIVVSEEEGVLNKGGLRYEDEFVRHKVLDCIGDVFLSGARIKGSITVLCSGHRINNQLMHQLFSSQGAWRMVRERSH